MSGAGGRWLWFAGLVATVSCGGLALCLALSDRSASRGSIGTRRRARPEEPGNRFDAPLERRSATHVVVQGFGESAREDASAPTRHAVWILLDTALTVPITSPSGERFFGLAPGIGAELPSTGFSGAKGALLPIAEASPLTVSVGRPDDPARILTRVEYLGVDSIAGADVIAPPELLGPEGGAIAIDLAHLRFSACETLDACTGKGDWIQASGANCPRNPELLVVGATVGDARARLLLDTGGSTWLRRRFFEAHSLSHGTSGVGQGELIGAEGHVTAGSWFAGKWPIMFGTSLERALDHLWVIDPSGGAAVDCDLDGSIGLDSLDGCAIAIADQSPRAVWLKCDRL